MHEVVHVHLGKSATTTDAKPHHTALTSLNVDAPSSGVVSSSPRGVDIALLESRV